MAREGETMRVRIAAGTAVLATLALGGGGLGRGQAGAETISS